MITNFLPFIYISTIAVVTSLILNVSAKNIGNTKIYLYSGAISSLLYNAIAIYLYGEKSEWIILSIIMAFIFSTFMAYITINIIDVLIRKLKTK